MLNVLMTGPYLTLPGGVVPYVSLLLEHVDRTAVSYTYVEVAKSSATSPMWRRPFEYVASIWRFGRTLLRVRPDVVHLNPSLNQGSLPLHLCLILIAKGLARPTYLFFHGWDEAIASAMIRGTGLGGLVKAVLRRADHCSVLCSRFRDQLVRAGWQPEDVEVLPLMIEVEKYQELGSEVGQTVKGGSQFEVLLLSRLAWDKGVWEMLEAVDWLRQAHPDDSFHFVLAGDGPEFAGLDKHVRAAGLSDVVRLPGYLRGDAKYLAYQGADMFVLPSFHAEGFPTVVIEAMAAGLPVIYTPVGALAEIMGPENGVRLEPSELSGEAVGRAIWNLSQQPDKRTAMRVANQRLAQNYDVKVMSARTIDVYRHAVDVAG